MGFLFNRYGPSCNTDLRKYKLPEKNIITCVNHHQHRCHRRRHRHRHRSALISRSLEAAGSTASSIRFPQLHNPPSILCTSDTNFLPALIRHRLPSVIFSACAPVRVSLSLTVAAAVAVAVAAANH